MSELVPHRNNHSKEIGDYFSQNEQLADPVTRRDYFEHLETEDFLELIQRTASVVRTGSADQLQPFDGQGVNLATHEVPDQRDKEALLAKTWDTALALLRDRDLSDDDALKYAGLTVGGGILLTHPFVDGNGRTSRVLSLMMIRGAEGEADDLEDIVSLEGDHNWWIKPLPSIVRSVERWNYGEQPDEIRFIPQGPIALYPRSEKPDESIYGDRIIRQLIEEADAQTMEYIHQATSTEEIGRGARTVLDGNKLFKILESSEFAVDYAQQLSRILRDVQAEVVTNYLAIMRHPEIVSDPVRLREISKETKSYDEEKTMRVRNAMAKYALEDGSMALRDQFVAFHDANSKLYRARHLRSRHIRKRAS